MENKVKRILIDNGSSVNILFKHAMDRMQLGSIRMNETHESPLYGFGHNMVQYDDTLYLPVTFGMPLTYVVNMVNFYVINTPSSYNAILGRPCLSSLGAITSTTHLKFKFPTPNDIGEVKGDRKIAEKCDGQALALVETELENKRKVTTLLRGVNKKKHRHTAATSHEIHHIEAQYYSEANTQAKIQRANDIASQNNIKPAEET